MLFRAAKPKDAHHIFPLYRSVVGQACCVWNDQYPGMPEISHDIETGNLFVLEDGGSIMGAISIVPENEMDDFPCWTVRNNACEIARVVIHPAHQGKGHARLLVREITRILQEDRQCAAIHLSVATVNVPAYRTYMNLGFTMVGEKDMYGNQYHLCEKRLR